MTAIAVAEHLVAAPLPQVFAQFIDFSRWDLWMPSVFAPVSGPARSLKRGDTFKVGIGRLHLPLELEVIRVRPDKEICWRGGTALVLQAEHSFLFSEAGAETRVRSEEPLSGLLSRGPAGAALERVFSDGARVLLERFAAYVLRYNH